MNIPAIILAIAVALIFGNYVKVSKENTKAQAQLAAMQECWPNEEGELVAIAKTKDGVECAVTSRNNGRRAIKSRKTYQM